MTTQALDAAHGARKHAKISASKMKRVIQCAGSLAAEEPYPNTTSKASEKGTALHECTEKCLVEGWNAIRTLGKTFNGFEMTEADCEAVQTCLDFARSIIRPGDEWEQEQSFDLSDYHVGWGGISDLMIYRPSTEEMWVIDWKFGAGVVVEVMENDDEG